MSGGSKKTDTSTKTSTTSQPTQTVQPGMPGQISTLADQLAMGFGQPSADILAQLQQYYQPMTLPNYAPVTPATTPAPTPTTPVPVTPAPKPIIGKGSTHADSRPAGGYR